MKSFMLAAVIGGALAASGGLAHSVQAAPAQAQPLAVFSTATPYDALRLDAAYFYGGHRYCFYEGGWRGPGWYRCGYPYRRGFGWGGAYGWLGWTRPGGFHGGGRGGGFHGGGFHGGGHVGGGHGGGGHGGGGHGGGGHGGGGGHHH